MLPDNHDLDLNSVLQLLSHSSRSSLPKLSSHKVKFESLDFLPFRSVLWYVVQFIIVNPRFLITNKSIYTIKYFQYFYSCIKFNELRIREYDFNESYDEKRYYIIYKLSFKTFLTKIYDLKLKVKLSNIFQGSKIQFFD